MASVSPPLRGTRGQACAVAGARAPPFSTFRGAALRSPRFWVTAAPFPHLSSFDVSVKAMKEELPEGSYVVKLLGCVGTNLRFCTSEGPQGRALRSGSGADAVWAAGSL